MITQALLPWQYIDHDSGLIMPYYTFPCLEWLKKQNIRTWNVYEFGSGYSTIWWRLNASSVWATDTHEAWARAMNAELRNRNDFVDDIPQAFVDHFDCIIVDGDPVEQRPNCVEACRKFLSPGGFLIIDNYDQEGFPPDSAYEKFLEGWERQVFAQPNHSSWKTAVFIKPK